MIGTVYILITDDLQVINGVEFNNVNALGCHRSVFILSKKILKCWRNSASQEAFVDKKVC